MTPHERTQELAERLVAIRTLSAVELVEILEEAIPPRCIGPEETLESAHRYAGSVGLIASLVDLIDQA